MGKERLDKNNSTLDSNARQGRRIRRVDPFLGTSSSGQSLVDNRSRLGSSHQIVGKKEATSVKNVVRISDSTENSSFPEFPSMPQFPSIPTLDMKNPDWLKIHNEEMEAWRKQCEETNRHWQAEIEQWQEKYASLLESYEVTKFYDEDGFLVYEYVSKDGRNKMLMKTKTDKDKEYTKIVILRDGVEEYNSEKEITFKPGTTIEKRNQTTRTRTSYEKNVEYSKKTTNSGSGLVGGCGGCLIIFILMVVIFLLAVYGFISLF